MDFGGFEVLSGGPEKVPGAIVLSTVPYGWSLPRCTSQYTLVLRVCLKVFTVSYSSSVSCHRRVPSG
eukprot:559841-Rhodomonas_salina.1